MYKRRESKDGAGDKMRCLSWWKWILKARLSEIFIRFWAHDGGAVRGVRWADGRLRQFLCDSWHNLSVHTALDRRQNRPTGCLAGRVCRLYSHVSPSVVLVFLFFLRSYFSFVPFSRFLLYFYFFLVIICAANKKTGSGRRCVYVYVCVDACTCVDGFEWMKIMLRII